MLKVKKRVNDITNLGISKINNLVSSNKSSEGYVVTT